MRWIYILVMFLLILPMVSSGLGTFKQGECVDIKTILNTSSVTLSTLNYPNGSVIVSEQDMTNSVGKTFNYTYCSATTIGKYYYDYYDADGNVYVNDFDVTSTGENLTLEYGLIYFFALVFIVLVILGIFFIISLLPSQDTVDTEGNIMQISWLKYLRPVLWIFIWALSLGLLFIISNITLAYIPNPMVGNFFFALYKIAFWMTIVMLPIYSIYILVRAFQDKEMKRLIERGIEIKSTP